MTRDKFDQIIDFAIEREKEAVKFYQELQEMADFESKKDLFKDLEIMEQNHITILEKIRKQDIEGMKIPEMEDLKISDYLVEPPRSSDMTYQDVLILAMKKEEAAVKLYQNMAAKYAQGSKERKLFDRLSFEESKHKKIFEDIYDREILTDN